MIASASPRSATSMRVTTGSDWFATRARIIGGWVDCRAAGGGDT